MRLSLRLREVIKKSVSESFGSVPVYLFGSRTDDSKRGGDIDLAVDVDICEDEFKKMKNRFITSMVRAGYDLKIDLVQYKKDGSLLSEEIDKNKVKLMG